MPLRVYSLQRSRGYTFGRPQAWLFGVGCSPDPRAASLRRCEDDLTHKLAEIIKANSRLKKQEENGAPQHIIREFTALLQFHVITYFDNTRPGMPVANQRGGRPIKSISQRLKVCLAVTRQWRTELLLHCCH